MKRCFIPPTFGKVGDCSLHYFADACQKGYGQVTYLHVVDDSEKVHCSTTSKYFSSAAGLKTRKILSTG